VAAPSPAAPGAAPGPGQLVNLNTASATDLETLPEVGPVTAAAIVEWREANGGFSAVDELLEIDGIGETTLGQIAPFVTV
jgi:competence protein ComEA